MLWYDETRIVGVSVKVSSREGDRGLGGNDESEKSTEIDEMRVQPRSCGQRFHRTIADSENEESALASENGKRKRKSYLIRTKGHGGAGALLDEQEGGLKYMYATSKFCIVGAISGVAAMVNRESKST